MQVQSIIKDKLNNYFSKISHIEVINESGQHNVPANSETHFKIIIVTDEFKALTLIQRHRLINMLLKEELSSVIHALAIHPFTIKEWYLRKSAPLSPKCKGGSSA